MSAADMLKYMSRDGEFHGSGDLVFTVTVLDVRDSYGRLQLQVTPKSGHGRKWVMAEKVVLIDA